MRKTLAKLGLAALVAGGVFTTIEPARAQELCDFDPESNIVVVSSDISLDETWTPDNTYVLDGVIYVTNGATLTIEPGTVIRGRPDSVTPGTNNPGTLAVTRGAKIRAVGSAFEPIIMTSCGDDNIPGRTPDIASLYVNKIDANAFTAEFGGLIMLGKGYVSRNTAGGPDPARENQIEGLTADQELGFYGGCSEFFTEGEINADPSICDDDDSGVVRYFSLSYGGFNLAEANEINGVTLGGVGRETEIEYVEVFQNKDDGLEMFGGAVNLRHIVVANIGDDSIDYDEGWRGDGQFIFSLQNVAGTELAGFDQGDHHGEHDGATGNDASEPYAIPTLANVTSIGTGQKSYTKKDGNGVLLIRDNAGGRYYSSAFLDFGGAAVMIEGPPGNSGTSAERAVTAYSQTDPDGDGTANPDLYLSPLDVNNDGDPDLQLELRDNTFWCIGRQEDADVLAIGRQNTLPTDGVCRLDADPANGSNVSCGSDLDCVDAGERCFDPTERWDGDMTKVHFDNGLFSDASLRNALEACADPLPIRTLIREDIFGASLPDLASVVDPRPAAGSSLGSTSSSLGGFFRPTNYRGGFKDDNWAAGWTRLSRLQYFARCSAGSPSSATPVEVGGLRLPDSSLILWDESYDQANVLSYELLRSGDPSDFAAATTVENDLVTRASDSEQPAAGSAFFYLVRGSNSCGGGSLGSESSGAERVGP